MSAPNTPGTGDIFLDEMDRRMDILYLVQQELQLVSLSIVSRMARSISVALNKDMASYVDEVLAYRKMNFIDMISIKHQTLPYEQIQIGLKEELELRIEAQINALPPAEWLMFQFRDANLFYEMGRNAVVASIKKDVMDEFGHLLDEHFKTKRMQTFLERYPWLINKQ